MIVFRFDLDHSTIWSWSLKNDWLRSVASLRKKKPKIQVPSVDKLSSCALPMTGLETGADLVVLKKRPPTVVIGLCSKGPKIPLWQVLNLHRNPCSTDCKLCEGLWSEDYPSAREGGPGHEAEGPLHGHVFRFNASSVRFLDCFIEALTKALSVLQYQSTNSLIHHFRTLECKFLVGQPIGQCPLNRRP